MIDQAELDLQHACDRLVAQNVQCCLSSLVATLAKGYGADITSQRIGHGENGPTDLIDLCEQAFELASPIDDYEEAARQNAWHQEQDGLWFRAPLTDDEALLRVTAGTAQEACEMDGLEPYQREVYEHWAVTDWLATHLEAQGEKVDRDFAGLTVWARTTTGQAISMDGCIRAIARQLEEPS